MITLEPNDVYSSYDPYDLWATRAGVDIRRQFYEGRISGKVGAGVFALFDWIAPSLARFACKAPLRLHPITAAHLVLMSEYQDMGFNDKEAVDALASLAAWKGENNKWAWGLGFPWMSKNGLYGQDVPFVTHTPYVMEALLKLISSGDGAKAREMFEGTWGFLESLLVMHDEKDGLALSYAPVEEPRIVVNANAYASFAYALHAVHGNPETRQIASQKACRLARWVLKHQEKDGSWYYYADKNQGNFIDCFHTCFVIKNLLKVGALIPQIKGEIEKPVNAGFEFLKNYFYDEKTGLCRRFTVRDIKDPYRLDLYDQAEYLGLLIDMGNLKEARTFRDRVQKVFGNSEHMWCRIDVLGRRWGKDFLRWGIVPFKYQALRCGSKG